ncbi:MAG: zf-HC2 domain-containing protein [Oscillospiraceae bacterium]|nr:zf-HC2 domain-containing protein [Oscillospiraceae bacterium]
MNEISCDLCMDLMPLVKDGVASEDSVTAVKNHILSCENCRSLFNDDAPPPVDTDTSFEKFYRRWQLFSAMVMMFGIFFGLSLTASSGIFYNTLIMPVIGALGYIIFRKRALYIVPVLLFVTHVVTNLFGLVRGVEHLDLYSLLMWTFLYSIFSLLGVVVTWLLHFAFREE